MALSNLAVDYISTGLSSPIDVTAEIVSAINAGGGGGGSGAATDLSNLTSPTAINQDLLPGTVGLNLGSLDAPWRSLSLMNVGGGPGGNGVINANKLFAYLSANLVLRGGSAITMTTQSGGATVSTGDGSPVTLSGGSIVTEGPVSFDSPIISNSLQTTYTGSVSGTGVWSMPFQGASYKKFLINLQALTDAGGTITFPTPFTQVPFMYGDSAVTAVATTDGTTLTLAVTAGITGNLFVEGY